MCWYRIQVGWISLAPMQQIMLTEVSLPESFKQSCRSLFCSKSCHSTSIIKIPVGIHRTLVGSDVVIDNNKVSLGSLFFDLETLNNIEENLLKVSKDKEQKLKNFEKLRTVGKGAFGAAILYRKKDDGLMVIIKVKKISY